MINIPKGQTLPEVYCQECYENLTGKSIYVGNNKKAYCAEKKPRGCDCFEQVDIGIPGTVLAFKYTPAEEVPEAIRTGRLLYFGKLEKSASQSKG